MPTIEEMRTELEAAGYRASYIGNMVSRISFWSKGDTCFITDGNDMEESLKLAYAHYLQQEQFAKMEALLETLVIAYENLDMLSTKDIISEFVNAAKEAKELLAEKEAN